MTDALVPLTQCPRGPVLMGGELYILCEIGKPAGYQHLYDTAYLIRCRDWNLVEFHDWPATDDTPGHHRLCEIMAEPVAIEAAGRVYGGSL